MIFIGGGAGMVGFLQDLEKIIEELLGEPNLVVQIIFWILILIAALGGIAVMIGGLLLYKERIITGKVLITLGAGIGIIGLIIGIVTAINQGETVAFFAWITTSFSGIGIILSIIARFMAKRPKKD